MSRKYKLHINDGVYFVSFAMDYWMDLFVRETYFSVFADTLIFYSKDRLELFAGFYIKKIKKTLAKYTYPKQQIANLKCYT